MASKMNNLGLLQALEIRYSPPEWITAREVPLSTGFTRQLGRVDFVAFNTYPSRGLEIHGFELKTGRGDWLKELQTPDKAENAARYFHRWWLVVGSREIIDPLEVPASWGIIWPHGQKLQAKRNAPILNKTPEFSMLFYAALLRHAVRSHKGEDEIAAAEKRGREYGRESAQRSIEAALKREQQAEESITEFENASGIRIDRWRAGRIGEVVKMLLRNDVTRMQEQLGRIRSSARDLEKKAGEALEAIENARAEINQLSMDLNNGSEAG